MSNFLTYQENIFISNMDYDLYLSNLENFFSNLQTTSIKFVYFLASDLTQPKLKDEFKIFPGIKCFITMGETKNAWHIYQESILKYIITNMRISKTKPITIYNVDIVSTSTSKKEPNHGDHMTFSIIRTRTNDVIVKTHMTVYKDLGGFVFDRTEYPCNFTFVPSNIGYLEDSHCERIDGSLSSETVKSTFSIIQSKMITRMCKAMLGDIKTGCRKKLIRPIMKQKGGSSYKTITFMSNKFLSFMSKTIFIPLKQIREDLLSIRIIFDENNYFGNNTNDLIIIFYDFSDGRSMFYIDATIALKACYAESVADKATKEEQDSLSNFKAILPIIFDNVRISV
jgi:hypothetical protein